MSIITRLKSTRPERLERSTYGLEIRLGGEIGEISAKTPVLDATRCSSLLQAQLAFNTFRESTQPHSGTSGVGLFLLEESR